MPSRLDLRDRPESRALRERLPKMEYAPLVDPVDLAEVVKVLEALPDLEFPILSAGHFVDQLTRQAHRVTIADIEIDVVRMLKYMPAYYFPMVSYDNLVEKFAELVRANRPAVDAESEVRRLREQFPAFSYPVEDREQLLRQLGHERVYRFQGGAVDVSWGVSQVSDDLFPITDDDDLDRKLVRLIVRRPLITGHPPAPPQ